MSFDARGAPLRAPVDRKDPLRSGQVAAVMMLLERDEWARDIDPTPGPTFHLDLAVAHQDSIVSVRWHIEGGRPGLTSCAGDPCPCELSGTVRITALKLLDIFDPAISDPLLSILAPPADAAMSLDSLLYIGGLIDTWVPTLRRALPMADLDPLRAELRAGADRG